jgi:hypothetical protein
MYYEIALESAIEKLPLIYFKQCRGDDTSGMKGCGIRVRDLAAAYGMSCKKIIKLCSCIASELDIMMTSSMKFLFIDSARYDLCLNAFAFYNMDNTAVQFTKSIYVHMIFLPFIECKIAGQSEDVVRDRLMEMKSSVLTITTIPRKFLYDEFIDNYVKCTGADIKEKIKRKYNVDMDDMEEKSDIKRLKMMVLDQEKRIQDILNNSHI